MGELQETLGYIRGTVEATHETVQEIKAELRSHEKRISTVEKRWYAAIVLGPILLSIAAFWRNIKALVI